MRFAGRLAGGDDVFVHVSALPVPRPPPDEILTFEATRAVGIGRGSGR